VARGAGVAPRALQAGTSWALGDLGLHRVELVHSTTNRASCRVAAKAGYELEGTKRGDLLHADGWHDMHLHAKIARSASAV
jgi:ribosomal-protein-alanine N-acetyltransferase